MKYPQLCVSSVRGYGQHIPFFLSFVAMSQATEMKNTIAQLQNRKRELLQMCRLPEAREITNRIKFLEEKQTPASKP